MTWAWKRKKKSDYDLNMNDYSQIYDYNLITLRLITQLWFWLKKKWSYRKKTCPMSKSNRKKRIKLCAFEGEAQVHSQSDRQSGDDHAWRINQFHMFYLKSCCWTENNNFYKYSDEIDLIKQLNNLTFIRVFYLLFLFNNKY